MGKLFVKSHKRIMAWVCVVALMISTFSGNLTNIFAASQAKIELNGFQISATLGGFRTIYSVSDPAKEVASVGLVYGLAGYASESDMVINSSSKVVYDYPGTEAGKTSVSYGSQAGSVSYAMTMRLIENAEFYSSNIMVKAYAKLTSGQVVYSDCYTTSIYNIASYLYDGHRMGNQTAHNYLYDSILTVVNPNYKYIEYDWSDVVEPDTSEAEVTEAPTTEAPTTTTQAPTTEAPTTTSTVVDTNIAVPFGLVVSNPSDNTIGVVWGRGEIDSYNVYIDGTRVATGVICGYYEYSGYAAGTHTVAITTNSNGKESSSVSLTVEVKGSGTVTPTTTQAPTTTTTAGSVDPSIAVPFGLVVSCPSNNTIGVVWGRGDIDSYNVYIDGTRVATGVACNYYEYSGYAAGTHTVAITTNSNGKESESISLTVEVTGSATATTTTTVASTTKVEEDDNDVVYDPSIAVPFGMVVSNPSDNTIGVVWGAGNINTYNVYIDGRLVVSNVAAAYYEFYGYLRGTHTVSIATSSNGSESQRLSMSLEVSGTSNVEELTTKRQIDYDNSDNEYSDPIPAMPNLAARDDRMYFKMNNSTGGVYSDSQIYWCIVGKNTSGQLCYVDKDGNLIPASAALNTIQKGDRWCADICYSLAEADYLYMPSTIDSGRMYLSYGEQVYLTFNTDDLGNTGYAGPDLNNATDPNQNVLFEFIEFTITNKEYWGNTTRVDFYSFPVVTRLFGDGGWNNYPGDANHYDRTVGDLGTRAEIFAAFKNEVPDKFDTLVTDKRIMAPCKLTFNEGQQYANYFDAYINEFWNKYTYQDLVFDCDAGTFRGRVEGDRMRFTKDGDSGVYYIYKPTTQDVLEGKGNFNRGNSTELVIEAQLCAAINRGVAMEPENYGNGDAYYKHANSNFYSGFWHDHSYDGLAYGFCYDDVFDHSTLLHYTNPTGLIIDLRW